MINSIKYQLSGNQLKKHAKRFIIWFYAIGLTGFIVPQTSNLFMALIPFSLFLIFVLLMIYHQPFCFSFLFMMFLIGICGFFIEVAGVKTGLVFGNYEYGTALGLKVFETPVIIGLNWLMVSYLAYDISNRMQINLFIRLLTAAALLVVYDIPLEFFAMKTGMWLWQNGHPPLQNFIAWFLISFVFQLLLYVAKIRFTNPFSVIIVISQFIFFTLLAVFL